MIEKQKKEHDWEFIFLGANIDAAETAADMGLHFIFPGIYDTIDRK